MWSLRNLLPIGFNSTKVGSPADKDQPCSGIRVSVDELIQLRLSARAIVLPGRQAAADARAGGHLSRFRGRGIDYQESRNYQPGDDIRTMDWRVTARTGRPYTKLYQEERERPVIVMVDLNPSMFFGTRQAFKSVIAARTATLIGWSAVRYGDRIGALLFNGTHHEIRPTGGQRGVLQLIRQLAKTTEPEHGLSAAFHQGGLGEALNRLRRVIRPGSLLFILSDFYSLDRESEGELARLRPHNDLIACQILDTLELAPPLPGRYGITDGHHTGILDTASAIEQQDYAIYFSQRHQATRSVLRKQSIPLLHLATTDDVVAGLRRELAKLGLSRVRAREVIA